jgi:hypothetical protein
MAIIGDRFLGLIGGITSAQDCSAVTYRRVVETIFHGRLAGGTIPFIRRYSTICP